MCYSKFSVPRECSPYQIKTVLTLTPHTIKTHWFINCQKITSTAANVNKIYTWLDCRKIRYHSTQKRQHSVDILKSSIRPTLIRV